MPTSSFYHDNLYRAYPFTATPVPSPFPTERIAAANVVCSCGSPYPSFPTVLLTDWEAGSGRHRIRFLCSAGDVQTALTIIVPKDIEPFRHVFSEEVNATRIRVTIGSLRQATDSFSGLALRLEPTCVLWLKHRGIQRIQIANASRPRLSSAVYPGIDPDRKAAYEHAVWWAQGRIIENEPLLLAEGSNCRLQATRSDNRLLFAPQSHGGSGPVREFVSLGATPGLDKMVDEVPDRLPEGVLVRPDGLPPGERILYSFCGATGPEIESVPNETVLFRNDRDSSTVSVQVVGLLGKKC
jgi:hypothetical protein